MGLVYHTAVVSSASEVIVLLLGGPVHPVWVLQDFDPICGCYAVLHVIQMLELKQKKKKKKKKQIDIEKILELQAPQVCAIYHAYTYLLTCTCTMCAHMVGCGSIPCCDNINKQVYVEMSAILCVGKIDICWCPWERGSKVRKSCGRSWPRHRSCIFYCWKCSLLLWCTMYIEPHPYPVYYCMCLVSVCRKPHPLNHHLRLQPRSQWSKRRPQQKVKCQLVQLPFPSRRRWSMTSSYQRRRRKEGQWVFLCLRGLASEYSFLWCSITKHFLHAIYCLKYIILYSLLLTVTLYMWYCKTRALCTLHVLYLIYWGTVHVHGTCVDLNSMIANVFYPSLLLSGEEGETTDSNHHGGNCYFPEHHIWRVWCGSCPRWRGSWRGEGGRGGGGGWAHRQQPVGQLRQGLHIRGG